MKLRRGMLAVCFALVVFAYPLRADESSSTKFSESWLKALQWRSIGPANMGGRITALAVYEDDPTTFYVATASGGLLKTTNNGITFDHQFDRETTVSIGDVCVAPSDRNIVWVGTGEANPRNSVSYGDGVYKSVDGGKTFKHMGLKQSFQIGKILIHPKNPNIVYVGALGRLYGSNEERGLFKTTDGGKTWRKILYIDDRTGVVDMRMHPRNPNTLMVATYERRRDGFDTNDPAVKWGAGSGLYKTTDGGNTFRRINKGLPTCKLGRIGLDYYRKDPNVVFMVLESEKIGLAPKGRSAGNGYFGIVPDLATNTNKLQRVLSGGPADKAGLKAGDVIVKFGKAEVKTSRDLIAALRQHKGGDKVKVKFLREKKPREVVVTLGKRKGSNSKRPLLDFLGGQAANRQKVQGKDGYQNGGVYKSMDGGESWQRINSLNPRPMYFSQIRVDPNDANRIWVLGIALHRSTDGGKTFRSDGGRGAHPDHHGLWIDPNNGRHLILGNDGGVYVSYDRGSNWDHLNHKAMGQFYHVAVGPRRNYMVYGGLQDNGTWGGPAFTRRRTGPINSDWLFVGGGDGFRCSVDPDEPDLVYMSSQNGRLQRRNLKTGEYASIRPPRKKGVSYRFNWNTPHMLSHHNSRIFYCAGNYVFRSLDRGRDLRIISPEITATKRGSATTLAESPKDPEVLYVGTDDGALWITRDGGTNWNNITKNVGLPAPRWVSHIEPSRYAEGRAYVVFDGHRSDNDDPLVFVTEDFGKSWKSLNANLPRGSTRCLSEDLKNPDLLYLGTEFGAWVTLDRGKHWLNLKTNLPTVAVHAIAQHPTEGEIVAATHGRSLWVLDVTPLRGLTQKVLEKKSHLFQPKTVVRWRTQPTRGRTIRRFVGQNRPSGAQFYYLLTDKAKSGSLSVLDVNGDLMRRLRIKTDPGLHRVTWSLTRPRNIISRFMKDKKKRPQGRGGNVPAKNGHYRVVLTIDGKDQSQLVQLIADPTLPPSLIAVEDESQQEQWPNPDRKKDEIVDDY